MGMGAYHGTESSKAVWPQEPRREPGPGNSPHHGLGPFPGHGSHTGPQLCGSQPGAGSLLSAQGFPQSQDSRVCLSWVHPLCLHPFGGTDRLSLAWAPTSGAPGAVWRAACVLGRAPPEGGTVSQGGRRVPRMPAFRALSEACAPLPVSWNRRGRSRPRPALTGCRWQ